jgi:hypothetical protein
VDTAEASFRIIAEAFKTKKTSEAVKQHLATSQEEWLLLIDNADDPEIDISIYFPSGNTGNIIITSRNPHSRAHAPAPDAHCEVDKMEPEEAIDLMLKVSSKDLSDKALRVDASKLISELGHLALAINQAASFITIRGCTLSEYLDMFQRRRKSLMDKRSSKQNSQSYQWSVYTT